MDGIHHLDVAVSDLERSLAFYRGLPRPLGYVREGSIRGARGEVVAYLERVAGSGSIGLREAQSTAHSVPCDRYAVGAHHLAFRASSRAMVDERADDPDLAAAVRALAERVAGLEARLA